jgi:hypothetical protein
MAETIETIGETCRKRDVQNNEQFTPQIHIRNYGIRPDEEAWFRDAYQQGYVAACIALSTKEEAC